MLSSRALWAQSPGEATVAQSADAHEAASVAPLQSPETTPVPAPAVGVQGLRMSALVWGAGVAADQITTYRFSSQYGDLLHEENPFIQGLDRHPVMLVAAGTAMDVATGWATYYLFGRRHPRLAKIAFYGAAAYRTYLAIYNAQMMRRALEVRTMSAAYPTTLQ